MGVIVKIPRGELKKRCKESFYKNASLHFSRRLKEDYLYEVSAIARDDYKFILMTEDSLRGFQIPYDLFDLVAEYGNLPTNWDKRNLKFKNEFDLLDIVSKELNLD